MTHRGPCQPLPFCDSVMLQRGGLGCKSSLPAQSSLIKWSSRFLPVQEGQEMPDEPMQHRHSPSGLATHRDQEILTETLVGSLGGATGPRPVLVEGLAALAVGAGRVVLAHADQLPGLVRRALAGVAVAFAPAARPRRGDQPL